MEFITLYCWFVLLVCIVGYITLTNRLPFIQVLRLKFFVGADVTSKIISIKKP
jgi:hypothetical protein